MPISTLLTVAAGFPLAASAVSLVGANLTRRAVAVPILGGQNFPDPSVIKTGDGWHAFSTNGYFNSVYTHVQVAYTPDWQNWVFRGTKDAMPNLSPWVDQSSPRVWAPDVSVLPNGSFIMYYTAALASAPSLHCLGYATSQNVEGPYVDGSASAWICPTSQGGAIDPSGYADSDGSRYVVYKIDGNAIGHGGECGNTVAPIVPTPIMVQQVGSDGHSKIGEPFQILTNAASDGPYVEAPSLSKLNGKYVLFFSTHCYQTTQYDVQYAAATQIRGPYVRQGQLFKTAGPLGFTAPGGLDIAVNGNHAVWHANHGSGRAIFTGILSLNGNTVTAQMS